MCISLCLPKIHGHTYHKCTGSIGSHAFLPIICFMIDADTTQPLAWCFTLCKVTSPMSTALAYSGSYKLYSDRTKEENIKRLSRILITTF